MSVFVETVLLHSDTLVYESLNVCVMMRVVSVLQVIIMACKEIELGKVTLFCLILLLSCGQHNDCFNLKEYSTASVLW